MATGHLVGHLLFYDWDKQTWRYSDDGSIADHNRPCIRCGHLPTPEGYDACLGKIPGARAACCGHGVQRGYVMYHQNKYLNIIFRKIWAWWKWIGCVIKHD